MGLAVGKLSLMHKHVKHGRGTAPFMTSGIEEMGDATTAGLLLLGNIVYRGRGVM